MKACCTAHWVVVPFVPHPRSNEGVRQLMRVLFRIISSSSNWPIRHYAPTSHGAQDFSALGDRVCRVRSGNPGGVSGTAILRTDPLKQGLRLLRCRLACG